jgi:hypothetical protein
LSSKLYVNYRRLERRRYKEDTQPGSGEIIKFGRLFGQDLESVCEGLVGMDVRAPLGGGDIAMAMLAMAQSSERVVSLKEFPALCQID